jgi:hypothetical protein
MSHASAGRFNQLIILALLRTNSCASSHRSSADGGTAVGADVWIEMKDIVGVIALLDLLQSTEIGAISRFESPGFAGGQEVGIGPEDAKGAQAAKTSRAHGIPAASSSA